MFVLAVAVLEIIGVAGNCYSSCTGEPCLSYDALNVDYESCRAADGSCGPTSGFCNAHSTWKACCDGIERPVREPVNPFCNSTCTGAPCGNGLDGQCRSRFGVCGMTAEHCSSYEPPRAGNLAELKLYTSHPQWKACCERKPTPVPTPDPQIKKLHRNDDQGWTSYCTHVHCIHHENLIRVHSHHAENYGNKHVCKHGLHEENMCGCECYDEAEGLDMDSFQSANAHELVILRKQSGAQLDHYMREELAVKIDKVAVKLNSGHELSAEKISHLTEKLEADVELIGAMETEGSLVVFTIQLEGYTAAEFDADPVAQMDLKSTIALIANVPASAVSFASSGSTEVAARRLAAAVSTMAFEVAIELSETTDAGYVVAVVNKIKEQPDIFVNNFQDSMQADGQAMPQGFGVALVGEAHVQTVSKPTPSPTRAPTAAPTTSAFDISSIFSSLFGEEVQQEEAEDVQVDEVKEEKSAGDALVGILNELAEKRMTPAELAELAAKLQGEITTLKDLGQRVEVEQETMTHAPTAQPTAVPTLAPTKAPTRHPCDDGSHNCHAEGGVCYAAQGGHGWSCACKDGWFCASGCHAPHADHVCNMTTAAPTKIPTSAPTKAPTLHPCDAGSHDCHKGDGGICYKARGGGAGWICGCEQGFWCSGGCQSPHVNHTCELVTEAPSAAPTTTSVPTFVPTLAPTEHPCDSGSHDCHKGDGGICYKARGGGAGWLCGCQAGFECVAGCQSPHESHQCARITLAPSATPTSVPSAAPTQHPCDSDSHGCDAGEGGVCLKTEHHSNGWKCGCRAGYFCSANCQYMQASHTCTKISAVPTATPTIVPTPSPTSAPTPHACDDGSHGCDVESGNGMCIRAEDGSHGWSCGCKQGYFCSSGCGAPHEGHNCTLVTPAPTPTPTTAPTPAPTAHPCDAGSHDCHKGDGGICYKARDGGLGWTCGCEQGFWCSKGCHHPHHSHTCIEISNAPSKVPTHKPSASPTHMPTAAPTKGPTAHPCDSGSHDCHKGDGGICYKARGGGMGWTCGCEQGFWCSKGCHSPHEAHTCNATTTAPTPAPTSAPSVAPTTAPTQEPTHTPTQGPTPHACDAGSHACDKEGGVCYKAEDGSHGWSCGCKQGYFCSSGCGAPHEGHNCTLVTPAPTPTPTTAPTPAPTAHPCDAGSHDCHKGDGGICYKARGGGMGWTCGCEQGFHCASGCTAPHEAHSCVGDTHAPTLAPTVPPTKVPTATPTSVSADEELTARQQIEAQVAELQGILAGNIKSKKRRKLQAKLDLLLALLADDDDGSYDDDDDDEWRR